MTPIFNDNINNAVTTYKSSLPTSARTKQTYIQLQLVGLATTLDCDPYPKTTPIINSCPKWVYLIFNFKCHRFDFYAHRPNCWNLWYLQHAVTHKQENVLSHSSFNDCPRASKMYSNTILFLKLNWNRTHEFRKHADYFMPIWTPRWWWVIYKTFSSRSGAI